MSEPDPIQVQLRNEAIGVKAECEFILEMTDSMLSDATRTRNRAIATYAEIQWNMSAEERATFQQKIQIGNLLLGSGNAHYVLASQKDHQADGYFNPADDLWDEGKWSEAAIKYAGASTRYPAATAEYKKAREQYDAAWTHFLDAEAYAEGFEADPEEPPDDPEEPPEA